MGSAAILLRRGQQMAWLTHWCLSRYDESKSAERPEPNRPAVDNDHDDVGLITEPSGDW